MEEEIIADAKGTIMIEDNKESLIREKDIVTSMDGNRLETKMRKLVCGIISKNTLSHISRSSWYKTLFPKWHIIFDVGVKEHMSIDAKPRDVLSHISFASLFEGGYNNTYVGNTYY